MRESVGFVHLRAARYGGHPSPEGVSSLACHPKLFASVGQPTSAKATVGTLRASPERRVAERVGFEPTVEFPLHTLSKRAPSTTRTSLRL